MQKQLTFDVEAREAILSGVAKLSRAVVSTLGPKGRNAVLEKSWGGPTVTRDGVTVAREIELRDKQENLGAQLVKQAAIKTNDRAGDGTTTATLLAWRLYGESLRHLAVGANPSALIRGMRLGAEETSRRLEAAAKPVKTPADMEAVALVAANHDRRIAAHIREAFERVGADGVVTIEEGRELETKVEHRDGMQFDRGYLSPNFATDLESLECNYDKPLFLIYEDKIAGVQPLLPLLEKAKEAGRPLVIVAEEVEGEALATLVVNKMRGILNVVAVKAPGYGDRRKEMLRDLAILTGGTAVMKDAGVELDKVELKMLGSAKRVLIDGNNTTVVEGAGKKSEVEARKAQIRRELETTTSDYDREKLEERLAKLSGGVAVISVGAATETEAKERKMRYDDAKAAVAAAKEKGVLPGGGVALLRAARELPAALALEGDEKTGLEILCRALEAPARMIAENAGTDGSLVVRRILAEKKFSFGWNALTDQYGDLYALGIVDPAKVAQTALANAVSVAATLMTTDCLIVEAPKKKGAQNAAPDAGNDDGDF
jgi:chaperonin GroEL